MSHDLQGELMRLLPSDSWVLGRPARHGAPQADQGSPGRGQAQTQDPAPLLARVLSFLLLQDIRTWTGPRDPWKDPPGEGLRKGQVSVLRGGGGGGRHRGILKLAFQAVVWATETEGGRVRGGGGRPDGEEYVIGNLGETVRSVLLMDANKGEENGRSALVLSHCRLPLAYITLSLLLVLTPVCKTTAVRGIHVRWVSFI